MSIINPFIDTSMLYDIMNPLPSFFDFPNHNIDQRMRNRLFSDMVINEGSYQYFIDMPGFKKDDIKVKHDKKYIYIEGKRENVQSHEDTDKHGRKTKWFTSRSMGQFKEQMPLYEDADAQSIKCNFKDGVLSVTVPRKHQNMNNMLSDVKID